MPLAGMRGIRDADEKLKRGPIKQPIEFFRQLLNYRRGELTGVSFIYNNIGARINDSRIKPEKV